MIAHRLAALAPLLLSLSISACGPFEGYRVRTDVRLDDARLSEDGRSVDLEPVALAPGFRAGGKGGSEAVGKLKADWAEVSNRYNEALAEESTPELRLVARGTTSRYVLRPELVMAASAGDVWFGYTTDVGVVCTLWDRRANRVVERFTILATIPGEWRTAGADGVVAHSVRTYLASRMAGKELDSKITP